MQDQFIKERLYFKNVSPKTIVWYNCSFKAFSGALDSRQTILDRIAELRQRGVSAISVNTYLRCVNAYYMWLHKEHGREPIKIPRLKEEQKILATFTEDQINAILTFKPKRNNQTRAHMVSCLLLDTGLRISEGLSITKQDCDLDNLVIKVLGKGGKHRLVPMSDELRKIIYRHWSKHPHTILFSTRNGTTLTVRNFFREFKQLCGKLGIQGVRCSPHTLRHTFAVNYLRRGGNLEFLGRILGHSSILTTQKYLRSLGVEDLQAVHNKLSLLGRS